MHGMSMGKLGVLVWPISDPYPDRLATPIGLESGDEGDQWRFKSLVIPRQKQSYKVGTHYYNFFPGRWILSLLMSLGKA